MLFRLAYLHLTLTHFNSQGHAHFNYDYLLNDERYTEASIFNRMGELKQMPLADFPRLAWPSHRVAHFHHWSKRLIYKTPTAVQYLEMKRTKHISWQRLNESTTAAAQVLHRALLVTYAVLAGKHRKELTGVTRFPNHMWAISCPTTRATPCLVEDDDWDASISSAVSR